MALKVYASTSTTAYLFKTLKGHGDIQDKVPSGDAAYV
jgi:hypothetical protein